MIVESLSLKDYRNYPILQMNFNNGTNIIYGDNAQGKTNILEALYFSATTKSHRSTKDRELISFGSDESHIKTVVCKNETHYRIDMHLKKNRPKGIAVNGVPIKKAVDLFGIINIVLFSPEDLNIIKEGPALRRRFLDLELSQLDKIYLHNLVNYNKVLAHRNKLLKDIRLNGQNMETLEIWDTQLIKYGKALIEKRKVFIEELNQLTEGIHEKLSGKKERLQLAYEPCVESDFFQQELAGGRERDVRLKSTNTGPHKDDVLFSIGGMDARKFASQGQQRTCALALKLAEIELVKKKTGDIPVLLLDDVLSELDKNRQNFLLDGIGGIQTIVTCTGLDEFIKNRFQIDKVYQVVQGKVFSRETL